ncbi:MAG: hypothetical protein HYY16_06925 [Planctomycetes bacterium]|nr:hypothetical protein [Planctomycetota bacterium]
MKLASCTLLALAMAVGVRAQDKAKDCDLKTIETGVWCPDCKCFCGDTDCALDEKGNCTKCGEAPEKVEICVKTVYSCACGHQSLEAGTHCEEEMQPTRVKALVVYKCEGCGATLDKDGACTAEACAKAGKKAKKVCDKSGTWPHGGSAPTK